MKKTILAALVSIPMTAHAGGYLAPFVVNEGDSCDSGCALNYDANETAAGLRLGSVGGRGFIYGGEIEVASNSIGGGLFVGAESRGLRLVAGASVTQVKADLETPANQTNDDATESAFGPFVDLSYRGFFVRAAQYDADFTFRTNDITGKNPDGSPILGAEHVDALETTVKRYSAGYRIDF